MRLLVAATFAAALAAAPAPAGALPAAAAVEPLVAADAQLPTMPERQRADAARALGERSGVEAAPAATRLVVMLADRSGLVRAQAAAGLAKLGADAYPAMLAVLEGGDAQIQDPDYRLGNNGRAPLLADYVAWAFINSRSSPEAALIRWAGAERPPGPPARGSVRPDVFLPFVLASRGEAVVPAAAALLEDSNPRLRLLAVATLRRLGPAAAEAAEPLARFVAAADGEAAAAGMAALGAIGAPAQARLLALMAGHRSPIARAAAAASLTHSAAAAAALARLAADDPEASVRAAALDALVDQPEVDAAAVPLLIRALPDERRRAGAAFALARAAPSAETDAAAPALASLLDAGLGEASSFSYDLPVIATIAALAGVGPAGREALARRFADPARRLSVCAAASATLLNLDDHVDEPRRTQLAEPLLAIKADCPPESPAEAASAKEARPDLEVLTNNSSVSYAELIPVCQRAVARIAADETFRVTLAARGWDDLAGLAENCPPVLADPALGARVADRINGGFAAFESWAMADRSWEVLSLLRALPQPEAATDAEGAGFSLPLRLAAARAAPLRHWAMDALAAAPPTDAMAVAALRRGLVDSEADVAAAAAEAMIAIGLEGSLWDEAAGVALNFGMEEELRSFLDAAIDELRPPTYILMSARFGELPDFPWPPPRYASIVTFGREVDRRLLGAPTDNLGRVHDRLVRALVRADPGFESGLFGAPGGFVLLTKLEQVREDGSPLPGRERWRDVRPPPRSLTDYVVRLFLAPPGYYRTIAFLFTDRTNFGFGAGRLPAFSAGGQVLPDKIAAIPYGSRQAYALVYSFAKRDAGAPRPYTALSGTVHLSRSGLLQMLAGH